MTRQPARRNFKEWQFFKLKLNFEDPELEQETKLDAMTWKQWINNSLKRTHGLFGEGIEYSILNHDSDLAYLKVGYHDKDTFSSAVSTYISSEELVGCPLFVTILHETSNLKSLEVGQDDEIWLKRAIESEDEDHLSD